MAPVPWHRRNSDSTPPDDVPMPVRCIEGDDCSKCCGALGPFAANLTPGVTFKNLGSPAALTKWLVTKMGRTSSSS